MSEARAYRIGEVAARAGVSTRTLRYYGELGLLEVSAHSPGGARRYGEEDVERLLRIRELQVVMGFNLDQIKRIVSSESRLNALREEYRSGTLPTVRQRELVAEAIELNDGLRADVRDKIARTQEFLGDLDDKAARYRTALRDLEEAPAPTG
jgi:MerR family transcriptional regulator, repressor of the yfmOP operon